MCGGDAGCPRWVTDRIPGPRVSGFRCRTEFLDDVSETFVVTGAMIATYGRPSSSSSSAPASDDEDDDGAELVRFMKSTLQLTIIYAVAEALPTFLYRLQPSGLWYRVVS